MFLKKDTEPNWTKVLDPDPNSMYLDPQQLFNVFDRIHILNAQMM